ncbi:E3 ubiquitin/ISG15 ligase TRIM25 [Xenopus tropicalis]|uniref:E3 ubiquitin/ISG15 ligase TRIM25 n=1 Tax=Xenopus tropicalis TaxID=8364 RepID=A0A8J1J2R3_XENTR|nr:E3 ubiquitin/ISG15 ligase TRIM25 [Xenopus tropicalis]
MAAADLRDELSCSICLSIYTDPVSLPCGHNFCRGCIGGVLGTQEGSGAYSCPECRAEYQERPALPRNRALGNIAERFRPTETEPGETGIFCTYCLLSPVPAAKSCLLCEASLCDTHLRGHCQSAEHVLTEPTASFMGRKCSVHHKVLEYHCCEDSACICVSCCLAGGHRGHRVDLLSEASEKKKEKLRKVLEKLSPEREETERGAQRLQERRREVAEVAAGETERVTALFRGIREELEALEKRLLSDISRQKEELCLQLEDLIQQLEIKKDELSRKIRHIEELCNMADPLTVLQEQCESHGAAFCGAEGADNEGREREGTEGADTEDREREDTEGADTEGREREDTEGADNEGREREGIKDPAVGDLDVGRISETLLTGLAGIVTGVKGRIPGQEATELVLDTNTAGNDVSVSGDGKSVSYSHTDQRRPQTPERFQVSQALSTRSFPSGRHYWEVEGSESGYWGIGVGYPSIERRGDQSWIGNNNKSWCLWRWNNIDKVKHDWEDTKLPHVPSCRRIRISLDYEAGLLSFYELSEPIRHLHTFTASFTEPLHAAFWVGGGACVRIIS